MRQRTHNAPASAAALHRAGTEESLTAARSDTNEAEGSARYETPSPELQTVTAEEEPRAEPEPMSREEEAASSEPASTDAVLERMGRVERQNRWMKFTLLGLAIVTAYLAFDLLAPKDVIVRQTLLESEEVKLIDKTGQTRFFLRMYSRVPVLQLLDSSGKPRMSLGLRFDDSPFVDLSDKTGTTRATFEMTAEDTPTLELFDENGETTFKIK